MEYSNYTVLDDVHFSFMPIDGSVQESAVLAACLWSVSSPMAEGMRLFLGLVV